MNVPFFRVDASGNELRYVREVLESGWLTSGGRVLDFEAAFAEATSSKHAIAVNSCTAALHLACEAAGVGPGSEVLVPSVLGPVLDRTAESHESKSILGWMPLDEFQTKASDVSFSF